eukprot:XP_001692921.1 hypothetical protein CHLREDRAFT_205740 [Chlamydomonas reinhardtii]
MAGRSWVAALDGLPGLSTAEKGKARVLLLRKSQEEASLLVSGLPDVAAEAIKEILRQEGRKCGSRANANRGPPAEFLEVGARPRTRRGVRRGGRSLSRCADAAAGLGITRAGSATPNADAQPPITMAAPKEVLEGQAATTKQALEGQAATLNETLKEVLEEQAATTKQALEALKEALTDNRATWPFPVSTVDWNQLEQSWAAYLTEVPIKKKMS